MSVRPCPSNFMPVFFSHHNYYLPCFIITNFPILLAYHIAKSLRSFLIVSIDYRRAPQNPFPAALEDIDKVYRFLIAHQISYKIDVNRIVVAGDSAGGMKLEVGFG